MVVFFFIIYQYELAIGYTCVACILNPSPCPSPLYPSRLSQTNDFGSPASYIKLALVICFTYGNAKVSMLFSQITPPLFWVELYLSPQIDMSGFPGSTRGKEPACQCRRLKRRGLNPWVRKSPWKRAWANHSSTLSWRIPWTEEPEGLQSIGAQRVGHN